MSKTVASVTARIRLKYGIALNRSRAEGEESALPYVGLENIEASTGRYLPPSAVALEGGTEDAGSQANRFSTGDVLFGKLRPYLAKAWVAEFDGRASTEFIVMTPTAFHARFLLYVCLHAGFISAVDSSTFGSKMPRAEWGFIGGQYVPRPPLAKQQAIASYLDRETAKIDEMITAKERLVGFLAEKRRALITQAVTRGLTPKAPMKDSGVEWLGETPSHWPVRRLAYQFRERDERNAPDLPLLEVSVNHGVIRREFSTDRIESTAADFNTYKVARQRDIVFNKMRMWQGAVGAAPMDGLVSPDYVVAEPVGELSSGFAALLFRIPAFSAECGRRSYGLVWDRLRLYWDGFRDISVAIPPNEEQDAIVQSVTDRCRCMGAFQAEMLRSIDLLRERRSALIAAAVIGQIDVEDAA